MTAVLLATALLGCGEDAVSTNGSRRCESTRWGDVGASYLCYEDVVTSADGTMAAAVVGETCMLTIVDLVRRVDRTIDLSKLTGDSIRLISIGYPDWCPWSNDYLLVFALSSDQPSGSRTSTLGAYPYFLHLPSLTMTRIDLGWSEKMRGRTGRLFEYYARWLPGSTAGNDTLLIDNYGGEQVLWEYHVQTKQFIEPRTYPSTVWSRDRRRAAVSLPGRLLVNGVMVAVHHNLGVPITISPDGRRVAAIARDGRGGQGFKVVLVELPERDTDLESASTWREIPISDLNCLFAARLSTAFISNDQFIASARYPFDAQEELMVFGLDGMSQGKLVRR